MIILGVDTALRTTGYGVIEMTGKQFRAIDCGVIKNPTKASHSECLRRLSGGMKQLAEVHKPEVAAIEGAFFFRNAKTAMVLGMARGAVVSTLSTAGVECFEYAPTKAKQVVTGFGRAGKEQVAQVMAGMFKLNLSDIPDDATDALCIAVCHGLNSQALGGLIAAKPI